MVLWELIRFSSDTVLASFLPPSPERVAVYKENYGAPFEAAHYQNYLFVSKGYLFLEEEYLLTHLVHRTSERSSSRKLGFRYSGF
jgi:hypothetical protein